MHQVGVLVGQSSNYLMPWQELTVTAGVGAYSSAAKPSISIGGSSVAVTAGQGSYKNSWWCWRTIHWCKCYIYRRKR